MFSKFLFNENAFDTLNFNPSDKNKGDIITSKYKKQVKENLNIKFKEGKIIDGSATQQEWFPLVESDIFLSHSHKDIKKAKIFAGWVKNKFDLDVFIDYNIWGNINDLLRIIDKDYCFNKRTKTYSYEKRNITTSHVHMMLINAIAEMMNKTECIMFFETSNSINLKKLTHSPTVESPWIYNELFLSKIIQKVDKRKTTKLFEARAELKTFSSANEKIDFVYKADKSHLVSLSSNDLKNWQNGVENIKTKTHPLDLLYIMKNIS